MRLDGKLDRNGELFLVSYLDGYLFYVPRLGILALIDHFLALELQQQIASDGLKAPALLDLADKLMFPQSWHELISARPDSRKWAPTALIMSNTQKCTLRCRYCYADGGRLDDADIEPEVATAAIDLIIENAKASSSSPGLIFLGEGEATANWRGFKHSVDYFHAKCLGSGLKPSVQLSTNGLFSKDRVEYISNYCDSLTFSLDGIEAAHDKQRVLPNGRGSFALIAATLREFDAVGKRYAIWTTATQDSAALMTEFVKWVGEHTLCKEVHIDPVFNMGGVSKTAEHTEHVDGGQFVQAYRTARQVAARLGISLVYSPASLGWRTSFCGAANASNFLVTSRGLVTSCNEVLRSDDPRAELFTYGVWDAVGKRFNFNSASIERLSRLNVHEIPKCQGCFAKYNCAGDCYARSSGGGTDPWSGDYTVRCSIAREILKDNLALTLLEENTPRTLNIKAT